MNKVIENIYINELEPLIPPRSLKAEMPITASITQHIINSRETIKTILARRDSRLLAIVGPCSIHDTKSALEYAEKLAGLQKIYQDKLFLLMRVYFEKPRTTIGWKGL